jgi:hypothetical protein
MLNISKSNKGYKGPSFKELVLKNFQYLVDIYGFHIGEDNKVVIKRFNYPRYEYIRYESPEVFVSVGYDDYGYELELYFGLIRDNKKDENRYSLNTAINLMGQGEPGVQLYPVSRYDFAVVIPLMAIALKQYALKGIEGNQEYYKKIENISHEESVKLTKKYMQQNSDD